MHFLNVKLNLSSTKMVILPCEELREEIVSKLTYPGAKKRQKNQPMFINDYFKCFYHLLSLLLTKVKHFIKKGFRFLFWALTYCTSSIYINLWLLFQIRFGIHFNFLITALKR